MFWWSRTEDEEPGRTPVTTTLHHGGTPEEFVRMEVAVVRLPGHLRRKRLVARAYQCSDRVTLSLESIRLETSK